MVICSGGGYPASRLRRLRRTSWLRRLVSEVGFSCGDLVWPVFVIDQEVGEEPIDAMPGICRLSRQELLRVGEEAVQLGIPCLALFPCVRRDWRDDRATRALDEDGLIPRSVRLLKSRFPQLGIMCDVALDPFTSHAHDGLLDVDTGDILNDETIDVLCGQALVQAQAGCDILSPSDMMDGRIGRIRTHLDAHGWTDVCLAAYTAKYASGLYGPFRQALLAEGLLRSDKKTYQMSPDRHHEPVREAQFDTQEGADLLIVKPSMFYFDILWRIKKACGLPTMIYQVSGEYTMMVRAFEEGLLDKEVILEEFMVSAKRAGADAVVTYFAPDIARMIKRCAG